MSPSRAFKVLTEGSTDLVVIDWEGEASSELVAEISQWNKWKKPTIVAVSDLDYAPPGVHIAVKKPLTDESLKSSFKAAYSRMLFDHRRSARHALMASLVATDDNNRPVQVTVINIGQGGVGLNTKENFMIGDELSFHLLLPGEKNAISVQARVLWIREHGAAGCEFVHIPAVDREILDDWLIRKSEVKKPLTASSEHDATLSLE